jgi:LptD protein
MRPGPARVRGRGVFVVLSAVGAAGLALSLAALPVAAFNLSSHPGESGPAEIKVQADTVTYDRAKDRLEARGHVHATRLGATLTVDHMVWERATGLIVADGAVHVEDGDSSLDADAIRWHMNDATGEVDNGRLVLEGRYHLEGARLERVGPDRYTVSHGLFSTCPCHRDGSRDWSVVASRIDMRVPGTMVARSVRFRIHDVPVLYLPVFLFPTSGRQTGLLIPELGADTRDGLSFSQPFYWAIDPSHDLTVSLDARSKRGNGGSLRYRYMPSPYTQGDLRMFGLQDRDTGQFQGEVNWRHTTRALAGWTLHADVNAVNDRNFLRTISDATEERTADRLESNVYLERTNEDSAAVLLARRIIDLTAPSDTTVQQLPLLRAERFQVPVAGLPIWAGARADGAYLFRESGARAFRATAAPELVARLPLWDDRVTATPRVGALFVWYSAGAGGGPADRTTEAYPASLTLSGHGRGRLFGRVHEVEPELSYTYIPVHLAAVDTFDALESLKEEHRVDLRLLQSLGLVHWRLSAGYDLEAGRQLPYRSEVDVGALPVGALQVDTIHDGATGRPDRVVVDWRLAWGWGAFTAGTLFDRGTVAVGTPLSPDTLVETGTGARTHFDTVGISLGPWRGWQLSHRTYYDQEDGRPVEAEYTLHFQGRCWLAEVNYLDLPARNLVRFRIGLIGPPETPVTPEEVRQPLFGFRGGSPAVLPQDVP